MKFKNIELLSFGKLINREINFGENINIIFGKNESGKTTIMNAILTILYGIYPTDKSKNSKVNWYNNELGLKANLITAGKEYEIIRRFNANIIGTMSFDKKIEKIDNNDLSFISEIPKYIYEDLYYINNEAIDNLERDTWKKIDNKLIFSYSNSVIKNPEDVIEEVENELSSIWRKTNRGNYRLKEIKQDIVKYNEKRNDLMQVYNKTKKNIKQIYYLKNQITNSENKLKEKNIIKDKINNVLPVANILIESNILKEKYFKYDIYKHIDRNILKNIEVLNEKKIFIENAIIEINFNIDLINSKLNVYGEKEILVEKDQDVIKIMIDKYNELNHNEEKYTENLNTENLYLKEYKKMFYQIFNISYSEDSFNEVIKLEVLDLKNKMVNKKQMFLSAIFIIIGMILIYNNSSFEILSILSFSIGIGLLLNIFSSKTVKLGKLNNISINNETIIKFEKLKELEFKLLSLKDDNIIQKELLKNQRDKVNKFFIKYNLNKNLDLNIEMIKNTIKDVNNKRENDEKNRYLLNKFEENKKNSINTILEISNQLDKNNNDLIELSSTTVNDGRNYFIENRQIESRVDELNKKLKLIDNYYVLIDEFNQSKFEITISSLNCISKEIDDIKDLINYSKIEIIEIQKEIGEKDAYNEICNLETEIELLKIEENSLIKEKENLIFMKEIIKLSNEAFKEENQPNIIKDVNKLFSLITGNKYDKLYINESTKEIFIKLDKFNKGINEGFSRGTKDQLFLALRFALINHYEKEVKLPIVLDEIFANWDDFRINNFIKSLNRIVTDRQLIFLTCKKSVLNAFKNIDDLDVNLLKIDCE